VEKRTLLRFNAFALAWFALGTAHAQQCEEHSYTISFSEFAEGTAITSQYLDKGVLFGSGAFITQDGANPTSPVLSGTPKFQGPVTATFVAPGNASTAAETKQLTFDAGYFDEVGSTQVTFLDINNASLGTFLNSGTGIRRFTAPPGTHSFTIGGTSDSAGFAIDNLSYTIGPPSALTIESPDAGNVFALSLNTHTRTPDIAFNAGGSGAKGQVSWTVTLEYDTDTARGLPDLVTTFNTNGTATKKGYYHSQGGRGKVEAQAGSNEACPVEYFYVVGDAIPANEITTRLVGLYAHGATPHLLTGIADKESTYRQFGSRAKYGQSGLWPVESYDGGSHIGLMQMPTTVDRAWDWLLNSQDAARLFDEKLRIAASLERRIIQGHRGLRRLSDVEQENMALTLYGPYAAAGSDRQYYRAVQQADGSYAWVVNTANNPDGVAYANDVRSRIH
jgi:hypothetical protein